MNGREEDLGNKFQIPKLWDYLGKLKWHTDDTDLLRKNTDLCGFFSCIVNLFRVIREIILSHNDIK